MAAFSGGGSSTRRSISNNLRLKSRENKDASDSDDDELFDGDKFKTRLMSMWNNMRHG